MKGKKFHVLKRLCYSLLRPLGINLGKRLLVSLDDQGIAGMQASFVMLDVNDTVLASGSCDAKSLPESAQARVSFFSSGAYFEQVELETRKLSNLPFQVRRHVADSLVFKESFRTRFAQKKVGPEHYWLDLVAADELMLRDVSKALPMQQIAFTHMVLVEHAIAALVHSVTNEPAQVFWMRSGSMLGLVVEKGQIIGRSVDYSSEALDDNDLSDRFMRLHESMNTIANRSITDRNVVLTLEMGELVGKGLMDQKGATPSRQIELRISQRFRAAEKGHVLRHPELYGLAHISSHHSLLEDTYQNEARASIYATLLGRGLLSCGMVVMAFAAYGVYTWHQAEMNLVERNNALKHDYAELKHQIPSPEQLDVLTKLYSQSRSAQFRADEFLAWISHITPRSAVVRKVDVAKKGPSSFVIQVQWKFSTQYTMAEKQVAGLLVDLGKRAKLTNSKLERKTSDGILFSAEITPVESDFKGVDYAKVTYW